MENIAASIGLEKLINSWIDLVGDRKQGLDKQQNQNKVVNFLAERGMKMQTPEKRQEYHYMS